MDISERRHGFRLSEIEYRLTGKKAIVKTETIHGKRLTIIFTFCNKAAYDAEFGGWVDLQDRVFADREKSQKAEGFKIYREIKTKKPISYREFISISVPFFTRVIFEVFKDNPDLYGDREEATLQIKVVRAERWEYDEAANKHEFLGAFPENPDSLLAKAARTGLIDLDHYYISFSVFYVLQGIAAPYVFLKRIDYNFMYKYLAHELDHYKAYAEKYYHAEFMLKDRIGPHMARNSDYTLTYLYTCLSDLLSEGRAEFRKMRNAPQVSVLPRVLRNFKHLVARIPKIKKKRDLEEFYGNELYAGSVEGVYYCGCIMCFIIAFSLDPRTPRIRFPSGYETDLSQLPKVFRTEDKFTISAPSPRAYDEALRQLSKATPVQFLEMYEDAGRTLGLPAESLALTTKAYQRMWRDAEYIFQREELRRIKKEGFYPKI